MSKTSQFTIMVLGFLCVFLALGIGITFVALQPPEPSLHSALTQNKARLAVHLIRQGANVHTRNSDGLLPIQAAMNMHDDDDVYFVLKHLMLAGASLNDVPESRRLSPAWQSIQKKYDYYWKYMIESKGNIVEYHRLKKRDQEAAKKRTVTKTINTNTTHTFFSPYPQTSRNQ